MGVKPTFESITAKQVMNRVDSPEMPFEWSINPYRGCTHGCSFCYARDTHTFMGLAADDTFQKHVFIKSNASHALEEQLSKMARKFHNNLSAMAEHIGVVAIGTATDPYQPIESRSKTTRSCLEVLHKFHVPVTVTTRSPLIYRDIDLLEQMDIRSVNISVNTLDHATWRNLEPATPSPEKRLETVQRLAERGITTGILLAPIIPYLTDSNEELNTVLREAKIHNAHFASPSVLRLSPEVKRWFFQVVHERYPHLEVPLRNLYWNTYPKSAYQTSLMKRAKLLVCKYGLGNRNEKDVTATLHRPSKHSPYDQQLVLPI